MSHDDLLSPYLDMFTGLYNKGLIYFDIPVDDDDYIIGKCSYSVSFLSIFVHIMCSS